MWPFNPIHHLLLAFLPLVACDANPGYKISTNPRPFIHPFVRRAEELAGSAGISSLALSKDEQTYFTVIKVGEINFRVALDTASSDLWITSSKCTSPTCASPRYPVAYSSPTFQSLNNSDIIFNASYADGSAVQGYVAKERVSVANSTLDDQAFALVTSGNVTLQDSVSGILGLGFPRLSTISRLVTNTTPFFPRLAQQGYLKYPLFGLSLTRNATGTMSFGAVDASIMTNYTRINWNKVVEFSPFGSESNRSSYLQWAIPMAGIKVDGNSIPPLPSYPTVTGDSSLALIDVGTSGLFGPYQDVARIFNAIRSARLVDPIAGQWAIPCDTSISLSFVFGETTHTLLPEDYIIGPAEGTPNMCLSWPRAVEPSRDGLDWQLGTAFLRTVYSVFSYGINLHEPPLIGFYPLRNTSGTSTKQPSPASSSVQTHPTTLHSFSFTIPTTLPNFLFSTPSPTASSYLFNSSIPAPTGGIISSGLGTSTYSALILPESQARPTTTKGPGNLRLPIVEPNLTVVSVTLGVPPGWNGADRSGTKDWIPLLLLISVTLLCNV